jgi:DNA-binding MarR family transcriptional regulator
MKWKTDQDKLNLLQATLLILSLKAVLIALWLTAIWATAPISQNSTKCLKTVSWLLGEAWYITLLGLSALLFLSLFLAYLFLLQKSKKSEYFIDTEIQPDILNTHKIIEFINKKEPITKNMLIDKLNYSNKIAKRYLKYLVKNKYIKIKPNYKCFMKKEYLVDENGESLIQTISNIKMPNINLSTLNYR